MKAFFTVLATVSAFASQISFAQQLPLAAPNLKCKAKSGESLIIVHSYPAEGSVGGSGMYAAIIFQNGLGRLNTSSGSAHIKEGKQSYFISYGGSDVLASLSVKSVSSEFCGRSPVCDIQTFETATLAPADQSAKIEFNCAIIK